jgi:hypothetical protein
MRARIKKQGAVRVGTGYCPKVAVLWAVVVAGVVLFQDTKQVCDDLCVQMRMHNERAEVIKL